MREHMVDHLRAVHKIGKAFCRLSKFMNTNAESALDALRATMLIMLELVETTWKNRAGIRVAVLDEGFNRKWREVSVGDIEKHYRDAYVRDQATDDLAGFLRGGTVMVGMDESYIIPVSILDTLKKNGTYSRLNQVEKEFFNAMYEWFKQRTPDNVYALTSGKKIPSWYANDLIAYARSFDRHRYRA